MSRMTKILINFIGTFILFFVLLICALIVSIIPTFYLDSNILEIICFLVILIPLSFILTAFVNYVGKKVIRRYKADLRMKKLKISLTPSTNFDQFQSYDDINVYFINKHHLKTISEIPMKIIDLDECKLKRKKNNAFIKKKIKKANEVISSKKHWIYQINLFKFHEEINENIEKICNLIVDLNNDNLYEIGKINFGYNEKTGDLIVRIYDCDGKSDVSSFFRYRRLLKLFCKAYQINYKFLIKQL